MIYSPRLEKIAKILKDAGEPEYRLKQIREAIYKEGAQEYSQMTALPESLRTSLSQEMGNEVLSLKKISEVKSDKATKLLFETRDGCRIEAVLMEVEGRHSLCISSQAGCAMGCAFCATGALGFTKNLSADEIADQILYFKEQGQEVDSVAVMGMGEPFANPDFFESLKIMTDPEDLGLGQRRISVSTVGVISGINRLAAEFPQVNLAWSLHSPFPQQREELMPATKAFPIGEVMGALKNYLKATNRKVFLAYVLLGGVNDSPEHAAAVVRLIEAQGEKENLYHVNLIKFNTGDTKVPFKTSEDAAVKKFIEILDARGIHNSVRHSFGGDIAAACGQLVGSSKGGDK